MAEKSPRRSAAVGTVANESTASRASADWTGNHRAATAGKAAGRGGSASLCCESGRVAAAGKSAAWASPKVAAETELHRRFKSAPYRAAHQKRIRRRRLPQRT